MSGIILTVGIFLWSLFILAIALIVGYGFPSFVWKDILFNQCVNFKEHPRYANWVANENYESTTNIIYIMNITNLDKYLNGSSHLEQSMVGPMVFRETLSKSHVTFKQEYVSFATIANQVYLRHESSDNITADLEQKVTIGNKDLHLHLTNAYSLFVNSILSDGGNGSVYKPDNLWPNTFLNKDQITVKSLASPQGSITAPLNKTFRIEEGIPIVPVLVSLAICLSCHRQALKLHTSYNNKNDIKNVHAFCFIKGQGEKLLDTLSLVYPRWNIMEPDLLGNLNNPLSDVLWDNYKSNFGDRVSTYCSGLDKLLYEEPRTKTKRKSWIRIHLDVRCVALLSTVANGTLEWTARESRDMGHDDCRDNNFVTCFEMVIGDKLWYSVFTGILTFVTHRTRDIEGTVLSLEKYEYFLEDITLKKLLFGYQRVNYEFRGRDSEYYDNQNLTLLDFGDNFNSVSNKRLNRDELHIPGLLTDNNMTWPGDVPESGKTEVYTCLKDRNPINNGIWKSYRNIKVFSYMDTKGKPTICSISGYTTYFPFPRYSVCMRQSQRQYDDYNIFIPEIGINLTYTYVYDTTLHGVQLLVYEASPSDSYALKEKWNHFSKLWIDFKSVQNSNLVESKTFKNRIYIEPLTGMLWRRELGYMIKMQMKYNSYKKNISSSIVPIYLKFSHYQVKTLYADSIKKKVINLLMVSCGISILLLVISISLLLTSACFIINILKNSKVFPGNAD